MASRYSNIRSLLYLALILLLAAGNLPAIDVWDQASPNDDTPANTRNVLIPGDPPQRHDVEAKAGPTADQDWYRLVVVEGHSYEVRVGSRQEDCFDFVGANFRVLDADATTERTTGVDYPGTAQSVSSYRATFVAPTNQVTFVQLVGDSSCGATAEYTIQLFDTTILNPGWSTGGGGAFQTFYSLQNTSNFTISMTITLFNNAGTQVGTGNFMLSPGQLLGTNTLALGVGAGQSGTMRITHTGPPEGILCDAAIANFSTSPAAIIPSKCQRALKGD